MTSDLKKHFIEVFDEVLSYFDMEHQFMREVPESTLNTITDYNILIGVSGKAEGNILFGTDKKIVTELAAKLMGIKKAEEINIFVKTSLADLYVDFCKRTFAYMGLEDKVYITDPTYLYGPDMKVMIGQTPATNLFFKVNGEKFQIAYSVIQN